MAAFDQDAADPQEDFPESDLERRFHIQIHFPDEGDPPNWETVCSAESPMESLRVASVCCERLKSLLETPWHSDPPAGLVLLRILDTETGRTLLEEEKDGALAFEPGFEFPHDGEDQSSSF